MQSTHRMARLSPTAAATIAVAVLALACSRQTGKPIAPAPAAAQPEAGGGPRSPDPAFDAWMATQGFQAWTTARPALGNSAPRYPDQLRQDKIDGSVLVQFVVDSSGLADIQSFRVLESTHDLFTASVRAALPSMRFIAAQVDGRKVRQLIQMPFDFSLRDGGAIDNASARADTAHSTVPCQQGKACPVLRLLPVHIRSASPAP